MSGTLLVAIYAAVVATGALVWQIVERITSKRTRLEVTVSCFLQPGARPNDQEVVVHVVNRSEHPVHVGGSFVWQEVAQRKWDIESTAKTRPFELAPRDAHNMRAFLRDLHELAFGEPVIAVVITQDGREFRSPYGDRSSSTAGVARSSGSRLIGEKHWG